MWGALQAGRRCRGARLTRKLPGGFWAASWQKRPGRFCRACWQSWQNGWTGGSTTPWAPQTSRSTQRLQVTMDHLGSAFQVSFKMKQAMPRHFGLWTGCDAFSGHLLSETVCQQDALRRHVLGPSDFQIYGTPPGDCRSAYFCLPRSLGA